MAKGMNALLKQAQKMQAKLAKMQEELADKEMEGSAGGGVVTAKVNGNYQITSLSIAPEVINKDDKEMLETLITAAVNDALEKLQKFINDETSKVSGGMNFLGM